MRFLPEKELGNHLLDVEKPARYLGGEYGSIRKEKADFRVAVSFPDLYEIGMSNQAIRILYCELNKIEGLACERVFAPDLDYEGLLRKNSLPLCSLENGIPLREMDMIAFSVGYELCGTGILNILDLSGVPLFASERKDDHPIVIGGGMALTNPRPFADFLDAVWIGEAEEGFFRLMGDLSTAKKSGASRSALLRMLKGHPAVWTSGKRARRAIFSGFGSSYEKSSFPIATVKPIQDHGVVEIMRGCPNGCRFCHAGYAYRPFRLKRPEIVLREVKDRVRSGGFKEITLSSLSSGDYPGIDALLRGLSKAFSRDFVSFQLPSLRVSTFNLPLIESLCRVRKSGLTFAIETPKAEWQTAMNKDVSREKVLEILAEAKKHGWKSAKFYFMIGLPPAPSAHAEVDEIYEYLIDLQRESKMEFNVNIGVFVPKPHTPYERAAQLGETVAMECFLSLKRRLPPRIKLSFHSPFISTLEGIISRGDERAGRIILEAFRSGLRLEAWEEHREMDAWRGIIEKYGQDCLDSVMTPREAGKPLPWDEIDMGISSGFLAMEAEKSKRGALSAICAVDCHERCGSCNSEYGKVESSLEFDVFENDLSDYAAPRQGRAGEGKYRVLFRFSKWGKGRFYPHLSVIDALSKAFLRADIPVSNTQGFNPQPKLEIAHPLAMGVESEAEIACVEVSIETQGKDFVHSMNSYLPEGLRIESAQCHSTKDGLKNHSLASLFRASSFSVFPSNLDDTDIENSRLALSAYPSVREMSTLPGGEFQCIVLNGKTKEQQALAPFKNAFGDDISKWPRIVRKGCLCSPSTDGRGDGVSELMSYEAYFVSYYGSGF